MKYSLFILLFFLSSCNFFGGKKEGALAKVNGTYLYPSDLLGPDHKIEDSSQINPALVDIWIAQQLWYEEAKKSDLNIDIDQQLEDYKKSLYIAAYQESILENANIQISEVAVLDYYKFNKSQFSVREDLYKLQYFIITDKQDLDPIINALNENKSDTWLDKHCLDNAGKCLADPIWVSKAVLEDLTIPDVFWTTSVKYQSYYMADNSVCVYRITERRKQGETAPFTQVKEEILNLLKHQKETEFLQVEENSILLNAQNKNKLEKY